MIRTISVLKIHLLVAVAIVSFDSNLQAQPDFDNSQTNSQSDFSQKNNSGNQTGTLKIKWTWQLPQAVKEAFYKSSHASWYVEKIVSYKATGKTVYRLYINNGNLLDSDHHDSFLNTCVLDISETGIILHN